MIILKSPQEIERMRVPCRIVAEILEILKGAAQPGVTTIALNQIAEKEAAQARRQARFQRVQRLSLTLYVVRQMTR